VPSRRINSLYAIEHLDHPYALTGHAALGATVDGAFVLNKKQRSRISEAWSDSRARSSPNSRSSNPTGRQHAPARRPRLERESRVRTGERERDLGLEF
jgi:hypothetical protein